MSCFYSESIAHEQQIQKNNNNTKHVSKGFANKPKFSYKNLKKYRNLSSEYHSTTGLLDLLLRDLRDELGFNNDRLVLRKNTLAQDLEVAELSDIDHRSAVVGGLVLDIVGEERPELVDVNDWAIELVAKLVEIAHTDFAEEPRMVLVEQDPVVVHASGVSATSRMLPVLADTAVSGAHVSALLPVLLETCRHCWEPSLSVSLCVGVFGAPQRGVRERSGLGFGDFM
nr:hypothetical protein CFP56_65602 [Quercus suber]